jgi:hypothetical protein
MSARKTSASDTIAIDPFHEQGAAPVHARMRLLGCDFEFESESPELHRIVTAAYADLPRHKLSATVPRCKVKLMRAPRGRQAKRGEAAPLEMLSGADFLSATTHTSDWVVLSPAQRAGLIVVSQEMLRSAYHVRYELLEFGVFTLATRVQGLVPLHAACIGRGGRGLLLMGDSGAGKTTAALLGLLRGLDFLSEDSVFVAPDSLLATGVANFLHTRRDALRFVPASSAAMIRRSPIIRRRSGVEKFEIDLRRTGFRLAPRPLRIVASVFLTAQPAGDRSLVTPIRGTDLRARLRSTQPYAANQAGWPRFSRRIASLPAFEVRRGKHPTYTVDALETILVQTGRH